MSTATAVANPEPSHSAHIQEVIRSAQHELNLLLQQRAEIMKHVGTIKQTLAGLAKLSGDDDSPPKCCGS
jgi:hypothetical protein